MCELCVSDVAGAGEEEGKEAGEEAGGVKI